MRSVERFTGITVIGSNVTASFGVYVGAPGPAVQYTECDEVVLGACALRECHDVDPQPMPPESQQEYFSLPVTTVDFGGLLLSEEEAARGPYYSATMEWEGGLATAISVRGACGVPDVAFDYQPASVVTWTASSSSTTRDLEVSWSGGGVGDVTFTLLDGDLTRFVSCTAPSSDGGLQVDLSLFEDFTGVGGASVSSASRLDGTQDDWTYTATSYSHIGSEVTFESN